MAEHFISIEQAEGHLLSAAAFLAENIKSSDGHAEAMKAIIPLYLDKGNVDLAAELANEIAEPFSRDQLLIAIAAKCADTDDDEYAMQLAEAVEDQAMQAQALEQIATLKAAKGQLDKAHEIASMMAHPDFVVGSIAVSQAAKDDGEALKTIESISFPTARVSALHQIAAMKIEKSDTAKATQILDMAVASAGDIDQDEEKIRAFCDIGNLFIEAKRSDKAIETFDRAKVFAEVLDNTHQDFFLVNCALGFLYAGSTELADRTLDLVTDKTQMASALLGFARDYWKKDQKGDALEALDEAHEIIASQREFETRDSRARNSMISSIAIQFAGFGKAEKGVEIARGILDPDEEMSALTQIAQILTIQNDDAVAASTLEMITEPINRVFALISVADAKEKRGDKDAAMADLESAAALAETAPQLASRSTALNEIATRFAANGNNERARELAGESLEVIAGIRDESSQAVALAGLSSVYEEAGFEPSDAERDRVRTLVLKAQ